MRTLWNIVEIFSDTPTGIKKVADACHQVAFLNFEWWSQIITKCISESNIVQLSLNFWNASFILDTTSNSVFWSLKTLLVFTKLPVKQSFKVGLVITEWQILSMWWSYSTNHHHTTYKLCWLVIYSKICIKCMQKLSVANIYVQQQQI